MSEKNIVTIRIFESTYNHLLGDIKALKDENDRLLEERNTLHRLNENQFNIIMKQKKEIFDLEKKLDEAHNACPVEVRLEDQRRSYRENLKIKDETIRRLNQSYLAERVKRMTIERTLDNKIIEEVTKLMEKEGDKDDG